MITFEMVAPDRILTKNNGRVVAGEELQLETYGSAYAETPGDDPRVELIPPAYLRFMSTGASVNSPVMSPGGWESLCGRHLGAGRIGASLFAFQREAVYKMVRARRALNAASMGLGKTIQALAALLCLRVPNGKPDLVICPGGLRANWVSEVEAWCGDVGLEVQVIDKGGAKHREASLRALLFGPGLRIVSYDTAATLFKALRPGARGRPYFNTVICDESHNLKEVKSKRFEMLCGAVRGARNVFLLSGTPAPNRPNELYTQYSLLRPEVFRIRSAFTKRYCAGHFDYFKRYDDRGASCIEELAFVTSMLVIRMRREDHLEALPAVTRRKVCITPTARPARFLKLMRDFRGLLGKSEEDPSAQRRLVALASNMFRETALVKAPPVANFVTDYVASNPGANKTVFFCVHRVMLDAVEAVLPEGSFIVISGKTPLAARPALIERFLRDGACTYALLTLGACSTGINLVPAPSMIFLELHWTPSELLQAEARINRIGGASKLDYTYLLCSQSLDDMVFKKMLRKNSLVRDVIDGGKDYGDLEFSTDGGENTLNNHARPRSAV
jgi:SWI/SNF-related matrix-associated actin-dependent regulator 1 of chromatin subfamily A